MKEWKPSPKSVRVNKAAKSTNPELPSFLAPPLDAPAYYGFSLVPETQTDGWCFGAITEFENPNGCDWGDGFVVAPDDSRAGIVWEYADGVTGEIEEILSPDECRWGVWHVSFPYPVRTVEDLVLNFRHVLPRLQRVYEEIRIASQTVGQERPSKHP